MGNELPKLNRFAIREALRGEVRGARIRGVADGEPPERRARR